tara:strand:- start:1115 stop:1762 length:648 start_codon:yes stop_codon:yes gene_type:complete
MKTFIVNHFGFTLEGLADYKSYVFKIFICCSALTLTGCLTSKNSSPLAPLPPDRPLSSIIIPTLINMPQNAPVSVDNMAAMRPAAGFDVVNTDVLAESGIVMDLKTPAPSTSYNCRMKDRFDRKALLAYEWDRSRVSVDVDGLNMSSGSVDGVFIKYKLRIQPEPPKKLACRYPSSWQGLIGSGYHELIVREDDTVWKEIDAVKKDVANYVSKVF